MQKSQARALYERSSKDLTPVEERIVRYYRSLSTKLYAFRNGRLKELLKSYYGED